MRDEVPTGGTDRPRIWFDVEDLFHFAQRNARPTGIQRVCFEIYRAAMADPALAARVGFLRHATAERGFVEADWAVLQALFRRVTDRPAEQGRLRPEPPQPGPGLPSRADALPQATPEPATGTVERHRRRLPIRLLKRAAGVLPDRIRRPGILFAVMQAQAVAALAEAAGEVALAGMREGGRRAARLPSVRTVLSRPVPSELAVEAPPRRLADIARRGDVLAVLGSPWFELDYAELAAHARGRLGLRLAVLLHDVIPVRRPEWVDRGTARVYRDWYTAVLPLADVVFANSQATADDLSSWCARDNVFLRRPVRPVPIGTGFGAVVDQLGEPAGPLPVVLEEVLDGRPYVLFVSTVEARKNHLLLFRVWRRLLEEMGPERVPDLVFAGKVGWMVSDLMSQIENSRNLDGRLHVVEGLDDRELRAVYAGCLFTVFPSFYEGWGLPVSESLAMGKPCVASNATALPEAGGRLARYFDPFDVNDATRVIRQVIEDRPGLAAWQEEVRQGFRPITWHRTASAILDALDRRG